MSSFPLFKSVFFFFKLDKYYTRLETHQSVTSQENIKIFLIREEERLNQRWGMSKFITRSELIIDWNEEENLAFKEHLE